MQQTLARIVPHNSSVPEVISDMVHAGTYCGKEDRGDAFLVADMDDIVAKHKLWLKELPRVDPFYAVKCNSDAPLLALLAQLGCGFDCASEGEMKRILNIEVDPSRIIYANPTKQSTHIEFARDNNVALMTFDNEDELIKIKHIYPNARTVLRILAPITHKSLIDFGLKFGCHMKAVPHLIKVANELKVNIVGVSFHVGSGCSDPEAFEAAVAAAKVVWKKAEAAGFKMELLDIGGGYPGNKYETPTFEAICVEVCKALDKHFPPELKARIIAEPGRYYVDSGYYLAASVIARRVVRRAERDDEEDLPKEDNSDPNKPSDPTYLYYLNDGYFGTFFDVQLFQFTATPALVEEEKYKDKPLYKSTLWGPCLTAEDCVVKECRLPELDVGDWLSFTDMGAYSYSFASGFNSFPIPKVYHYMREENLKQFMKEWKYSEEQFYHPLKVAAKQFKAHITEGMAPKNKVVQLCLPL